VPEPLSADPKIEFDTTRWGEPLLAKLIRERREMPKAERLEKYRNDSVDEVDTTDLENWALKARYPRKKYDTDPELAKRVARGKEGTLEWLWAKEFLEEERAKQGPHDHLLAGPEELAKHQDYLMQRHRLDFAKLYLGKNGGYNLRKFKKILKREMEEQPDKYIFLNKIKQKRSIIDIVAEATLDADDDIESNVEPQATEPAPETPQEGAAEQKLEEVKEEDPAELSDMEAKKASKIPLDKKLLAMSQEEQNAYWRDQFRKELDEIKNESDGEECYDFEEEEMDELLDAVENETLGSEEDAIAFFEKKYKEITSVRKKLNKKRPRFMGVRDPIETFLEDNMDPIESQFHGKWYLNERDAKRF
jgi:hypothetical protein